MRRIAAIGLVLALLIPALAHGGARLVVDGKAIAKLDGTYRHDGRDYVDVVPILRALGFSTIWNEQARKLMFKNERGAGVLSTQSAFVQFDSRTSFLFNAPRFLNARLCVPVGFVQRDLPIITGHTVVLEDFFATPPPAPIGLPYQPLFLKRVVIDPGHGGHDPGACSPHGLKEKHVVLAVAKQLARRLSEDMGIDVVMTRNDDRFIPLGQRARIANTSGADLFVSIHANGAFNQTATGTETFFLSFEASDRKAARMAAAENASLRLEKDNPLATSGFDDIKAILWDMVQTETLRESERLAATVQEKLAHQFHLHSRGVKQAPFYVLMGSSIPAILVEIGFMTTSDEADQLANPQIQEQIATALFLALVHYDTLCALDKR